MLRCHGQIFGTRNSEGDSKYTGQLFSLRVYGSRCDGCAQFYESGRQVDMSRWSTTHGVSRYQGPPCFFVHHSRCLTAYHATKVLRASSSITIPVSHGVSRYQGPPCFFVHHSPRLTRRIALPRSSVLLRPSQSLPQRQPMRRQSRRLRVSLPGKLHRKTLRHRRVLLAFTRRQRSAFGCLDRLCSTARSTVTLRRLQCARTFAVRSTMR